MKNFTHSRSPKTRILSAFMAFLIIALTFCNSWFVSKSNAKSDTTKISNSTKESYFTADELNTGNNSPYRYTGKIKPVTVSMYDYLTNNEGTNIAQYNSGKYLQDHPDQPQTDNGYTWWNYYNPYNNFNKAVSDWANSRSLSQSQNITLRYCSKDLSDTVRVYLYASDNTNLVKDMTFEKDTDHEQKIYSVTFPVSELSDKTYTSLRFRSQDGQSNSWGSRLFSPINISASDAGKNYIWYRDNYGTGWDNTSTTENNGATFSSNSPVISYYGTALYTGFFLDEERYNSEYKPSTTDGNIANNNHYNKYFWSANIAPRNSTDSSIKGLVDSTLTGGVVSQGGNKLPYFDSSFNTTYNSYGTIMKSWESGSGDNDKISFPFYEVTRRASDAEGYTRGSADVDTDVARYYQFDSEQITVLFHPNDSSPTASYFEERSQSQRIRDTLGKSGFFPFNDTDSWYTNGNETFDNGVRKKKKNGEKNNYGFGAKFEMNFKLRSDGKVDVLDENCKSRENKGKVNTRFEFTGDDDLWVFIDGNLVLDMGGGHAASEGYIDFCEKEVKANYITFSESNKDSAYNTGSVAVQLSGDGFTNKLNGGYSQDGRTGYKEDEEHTMTIFYMERGMSESNLKIRYNFPVEANFGKMKIREITDYSAVNAGLQALTEKASEDDVFQYTVQNTGTNSNDVLRTGDKAPTTKNFVRNVQGTTTQLTSSSSTPPSAHYDGETAEQGQFFDPTYSEVKGVSYNWVDGYAADPTNTAIVMSSDENVRAITDSGGNMYLMHGTNSVKSSGEFEGQFSRYSTMRITQGTDLYKPNIHTTGGAAADLTNSGTPARLFSSFYKIDKVRIFTTTQVSAEFKLENGDPFTFRNDLSQPNGNESLVQGSSTPDSSLGTTVQMTETFYNSPLLGAMTITKKLANNDNQTIITEPFTLRLKLTSIFGNSDVNVGAGQYEDIVAYKYDVSGTSSTPVYMTTGGDSTNGYYGEFTLSPGEILAIENIPVGTHYSVEEVAPTGAYREDTNQRSHVAEDIVEGVIDDKIAKTNNTENRDNAIIVNTRVTNELKLVKEVTGSRAGNEQNNKEFNFTVVLEAPEGVTFKTGGTDNYPITITGYTGSGTITPSYTQDNKKCTIVIPVSHSDTHNGNIEDPIIISGVPYDTKYTVTETIADGDKAFWTLTSAAGTEGTIIGQCTAKITNYFDDSATISLSKIDRTTKRIISGNGASGFTDATFKLLELKTTPDWTDSSVLTDFSNMINAANYTPAADSTYVEAVYPSTGVLTATNGELVINDSTAGVSISAGKKYFFYEVSAPTGYRADNKLSADRTIVTLTTGSNEVMIPNSSASVTVQKQNESGQGLPNAELDLYIHDVTKTETVNQSDVSSYATGEAAVPGDDHTSALPVLYTTNSNKISYTWSETADDPDYYNIKFINQFTDNSSWTTVKAVFIDGSNGTHEVNAESSQNGVFKFKNNGDYSTVYFTDGTNRTVDIPLVKYNDATNDRLRYGYGYTYKPAQLIDSSKPAYAFTQYKQNGTTAYDDQYLVQIVNTAGASVSITTVENTETNAANRQYLYWEPPADYDNNQKCWFYMDNNGERGAYIFPDGQHNISSECLITWNTGKQGKNGRNIRGVKIPDNAGWVKFACSRDNTNYPETKNIKISSIEAGKYLSVDSVSQNSTGGPYVTYSQQNLSGVSNGTLNDGSTTTTGKIGTLTFTNTQVAPNETNTQLSASFQPEDRYGLISSVNSGADSNNMITIDTALAAPYIDFFAETDGTGGSVLEDGAHPKAATGMSLKAADLDGTQGTPYKIRIPKNAKSFKIYQGSKLLPAPTQSAVIPLYVNESGHHYHEAGTTFNFDSSAALTSSTRRLSPDTTKVSISPSQLTTRTDVDYIYFTDVGGRIAGASGQVYAYYFGGVDGAYFNNSTTNNTDTDNTSWGGVSAQYTYTDNNGNKVYVFQPPKAGTNGTYPYVIFNNGGDCTNNTTIAAKAVEWTSGHNYSTTSSTSSIGLGSTITTYDCIEYAEAGHKTDTEAANSGTTYIYIKNNGTDAFGKLTETRYVLDDIHVEFFSDAAGTTAVGQTSPGYRPVKVTTVDGCDIYRMAIPDGATHFRINNGQKKTNGTTKANYRRSEIRSISANAMYKFVDDTNTPSDIWNHGAAASNAAELDDYFYYLDIVNKTVTTNPTIVKLATVVTGSNGEQAYIKWLKGYDTTDPSNPTYTNDDNYLDHVIGDIGLSDPKTVVNVVKKQTGTTDNDIYYYWKESKAPDGYSLSTDEHQVSYDSTTGYYSATVIDRPLGGTVTLTKTSKEQLGNTAIGSTLAGAKFRLVNISNATPDYSMRFNEKTANTPGEYSGASGGAFNAENHWLETGSDGKLILHNIPLGDYYLEEMAAPTGYSNKDSNDVINGEAQNKKVYFSMGKVGTEYIDKEISMTDEIAPAYIKLYEHINEKRDAWGNPTFIFKITQTQYADNTAVPTANQITHIVALTVDDDGKYSAGLETGQNGETYHNTADDSKSWFEERTAEPEYEGMYHIDSQGRIRLEPGTYSITRVPVSRYEFVENTWKLDTDNDDVYTSGQRTQTEALTVTIPAAKTAIVHYYDKVAYYDKFTHEDTKINKFYQLDNNKQNTTLKGIRVKDITNIDTDANVTIDQNSSKLKLYFIYVDGTEREITDTTEKAKLSFIYAGSDTTFQPKFSSTGSSFTITAYSDFKDNIYTLKATYDNKFSTNFDLVFERS